MDSKPKIRNVIAKNVKKYRKLNNMTQESLAEAAEVSNTYIANIECGQTWVSDKTLEKIAAALHIEIYLLFVFENDDNADVSKKIDMISYLNERQSEFGKYAKHFFSETFEFILNN